MRPWAILGSAAVLCGASGCNFISTSTEYSGLPSQHGRPVEFMSSTCVGMTVLFFLPVVGEPTVPAALRHLTAKAKENGARSVRVVDTSSSYFWFLYFPFSIIIHPATATVSAEVERDGPSDVEKQPAKSGKEPAKAGKEPAKAGKEPSAGKEGSTGG